MMTAYDWENILRTLTGLGLYVESHDRIKGVITLSVDSPRTRHTA